MLWWVNGIAWNTLILACVLLIGVVVGRRFGVRQGRQRAQSMLPIALRKRVYQEGQCPICDTTFFGDDTMEQKKGVVEHERKSDLGRTAEKYGVG